tara:strand:+ start:259 stop:945 length:687 start_codon:yes stop_codon:yes gene_type:complete
MADWQKLIREKYRESKTNKSTFNPREQAQKDSLSLELWKKKEAYKDSTKSEEVYEPTQKDIEFNAMLNEVYRQYEKKHNKPMSPELQNAVMDSITISQSGSNFKHMVPSALKGLTKKKDKPNEQQVFDQIREYEDANKVIKNKLINIYGFDEELMAPDMEDMDEEQLSKYKKDLTEDPKYGTKSQPYTAKQKVANHFLKNIEENNMRIAKLKNQFNSAPKDPLGIINE